MYLLNQLTVSLNSWGWLANITNLCKRTQIYRNNVFCYQPGHVIPFMSVFKWQSQGMSGCKSKYSLQTDGD